MMLEAHTRLNAALEYVGSERSLDASIAMRVAVGKRKVSAKACLLLFPLTHVAAPPSFGPSPLHMTC